MIQLNPYQITELKSILMLWYTSVSRYKVATYATIVDNSDKKKLN
jgi:hypothetical protein